MKVSWYCSYFVGAARWQTTEVFEPDECDTEFETEETSEDWGNENCMAICPKCKAELWQVEGHATLVD